MGKQFCYGRKDRETVSFRTTTEIAEAHQQVAERKSKEGEHLEIYSAIAENIQIGLIIWHLENISDPKSFRLIFANSAASEGAGVNMEQFIGQTMFEAFPMAFETELARQYYDVVRTGKANNLGETWYGDENVPRSIFTLKVFPLPDNHMGIAFENVTEHRQAQAQIKASLREKEVLLKEIHHRVKNNLQITSSLLYLQSQQISDTQICEILRDSQNRVKSMALVHEKLYQSSDLASIDFADYLQNLGSYLFTSYNLKQTITMNLNVNPVFLAIDTAIPCGLIMNEQVSNALKHAFPQERTGQILLELHAENDRVTLVIHDDGVGLPPDVDLETTESLGLQLVYGLTQQIDGTINVDTTDGTTFTLNFQKSKTES